jgi:hypothetical protein
MTKNSGEGLHECVIKERKIHGNSSWKKFLYPYLTLSLADNCYCVKLMQSSNFLIKNHTNPNFKIANQMPIFQITIKSLKIFICFRQLHPIDLLLRNYEALVSIFFSLNLEQVFKHL